MRADFVSPPAAPERRLGLRLLTALALVGAVWISAAEAQTQAPAQAAKEAPATLAPAEGWLPVDAGKLLTRIGFGSCLDQKFPQPIWKSVIAERPELFLMTGDNVYGDIKSADLRELREAYELQARQPEFAEARAAFPMLPAWDDHDYGLNDGGATFVHREASERLFRSFWRLEDGQPGRGVSYSRMIGPEGRRVQVLVLDTRSFRSELRRKGDQFPYWGRYEPDHTAGKTMLGEAQWRWLAAELRKPAEIRIVVSSVQVLAEGHGFERWGNLPRERQRLIDLIGETGANGVVIVSGDRHSSAMYKIDGPLKYPLYEVTSSSLNRSYGPSKDERLPPLISGIYHPENFGMILIDWDKGTLKLQLKGMDGVVVTSQVVAFKDLGLGG